MTTSLENVHLDFGAITADYTGLNVDVIGAHDMGLRYDVSVSTGDFEDLSATSVDARASWMFGGVAGPAVAYEYDKLGDADMDRVLVGVAGEYNLANGFSLGGRLVSDVDEFGDDITATVTGAYTLTPGLDLTGEYEHVRIGSTDTDEIKAGLSYALNDKAFVAGEVGYLDGEGFDTTSAKLGLGFRF